jgi:hypothetical protein
LKFNNNSFNLLNHTLFQKNSPNLAFGDAAGVPNRPVAQASRWRFELRVRRETIHALKSSKPKDENIL